MTKAPQQPNAKFNIFVTHVDSDGPLLRIYGQTDHENSMRVEKIMKEMMPQFNQGFGSPAPQARLAANLLCCAMYENCYYRARICSMNSATTYRVQFIDYGNSDTVAADNIRLLDGFAEAAQLMNVPPQGSEYILSGVLPKGGGWEETLSTIVDNLRYSEYPAMVVGVIGKYQLVNMLVGNQQASQFLVSQSLATPASLEDIYRAHQYMQQQLPQQMQQRPHDQHARPHIHPQDQQQQQQMAHQSKPPMQMHEQEQQQRAAREAAMHMRSAYQPMKQAPPQMQGSYTIPQYRVNPGHVSWRAHAPTGPVTPPPPLRQPKTHPLLQQQDSPIKDASFTFKSRPIEIDAKHEVTVSYVEEGPLLFSVQLRSTAEELADLMRSINAHAPQPLVDPPLIGSVCLGRYSVDKRLLRAVVMKVTEQHCKLHYVDYGHGEILPYPEIYQIPPMYTIPAVMAMRFSLYGVSELNVTEQMKQFFKALVNGRTLLLHVRPNESSSPLIRYGDLYDNGRNVRDILRATFPDEIAHWQPPGKLAAGAHEIVLPVYVVSCNQFYVQLDREGPLLEALMGYIVEYVKTAPSFGPNQLKPRVQCIALSSVYANWARAEIVSVNGDQATVFFVDFGNEETIPVTAIRSIRDPALIKLRAQSIRCILKGYEKEPSTEELDNSLEAAILDNRVAMLVKSVSTAGPIVELYDTSKTPIENILHRLKLRFTNGNAQPRVCNEKSQNVGNIRRSNVKTQSSSGQQQKTKSKHFKAARDDQGNKWNNAPHVDPPRVQEASPPTIKNWKEEENEQRRVDNRFQVRGNDKERSMGAAVTQNDRFPRDEGKNERFPRDGPRQERNDRNERYERPDDANGNVRGGGRGGARTERGFGSGRFAGSNSRNERNGSGDKVWSDKDSDTSSRGSGRHGRRGSSGGRGNGGRGRREGGTPRNANGRDNDGDSDRSFKSRSNGSSRVRDVRRDFSDRSENKQFETWSNKSPPTATTIRIPPPNITVGAVKNCDLVYMNSPTDFQVQLSPDNLELDAVMANIETTYQTGGKILQRATIKPGMDCVAQYSEDGQWYRATVRSVEAEGALVYFVDYGNSETVEFGKIKELEANFAKLAAQAIACRLLAASKTTWDAEEIAKFGALTENKSFEAEFVAQENKVYEILLREVANGAPTMNYVNEVFSAGADLAQAKNAARSKGRQGGRGQVVEPTDYAPLDQKWTTEAITPGTKQDVIVTWFTNPDNFYCQTLARKEEFRTMMMDIQRVYAKRPPMTEPLQVGTAVMAVFSEDNALYRAEVLELDKARGNIVRYVDFGNCAIVELRHTYRVEKRFMKMPKQAIQCSLKNVVPANGSSWSKANRQEIDKCFNSDNFECSFHDVKDDKYIVSLSNGGVDVAGQMVEKKLAAFAVSGPVAAETIVPAATAVETTGKPQIEELPRFDISLLAGQTLRVKVSNVAGVAKFHVQLPSATVSDKIIDAYMAEKDPKVMPRLSCREVCLGAGCLVNTDEGWRRAVVVNCSRTTGFDVRLIDTGANDEIPLDCMLALPGELSVMQNQAVECSLKNPNSSTKTDEEFRERIENKDVIIVVDEVDNNRLIVELYDNEGHKIKLSPDEPVAKISPLCPMPILHSTHQVVVTHADHSGSVWLKRVADADVDAQLLDQLFEHYNTSGEPAIPGCDTVAAKGSDDNWYRAQILRNSADSVLVRYIDYGNTEEISRDMVKHLHPRFHVQNQLAIEVALTVTLGGSAEQQQEILRTHAIDKEFTATLYNVRKKWIAELTKDDEKMSEKLSALSIVEVSKNREVQAEVPEMVVGGRYKVVCTHANSPAQFWLQREEERAALEQLQEKLQNDAPGYAELTGVPENGTQCVAMFSVDDCWYRAEVLDADEDIVTIRFIDYGNTDVVDTNSGKIKMIPDSLMATKRYATKCRLDVIPCGADDWQEAACEYFDNVANAAEEAEALVIADSNPRRVELFLGGVSAVEMLVSRNYATEIHTEEDLIDEIVDREVDPRAAYVSHAISPSEFWVQQELYVDKLEVLVDRFIVADMFPKVEEVKEGLLCVAKFPEDECWYRARVVSHADSGTEVIYIDYGNSAISTEIRAIPEDLAALPAFSKKCCLALPEGLVQWSEEAEVEFVKMAADGATVFLLDVLEEGEESSVVRLTLDDEDIVDRLAELCERRVPVIEERLPPLGEENSPNVMVSHVNSPSEFWTQAESGITKLEVMGDHLAAAESFLALEAIEEGAICAAKFPEDEQWYRAKVLSHGDSGTEVLYIDYGNSAVTTELRRLPEDIVNIPALSMCCSLKMPDDVESWSQEACEKFFELVAQGITLFQYEILEEGEQTLIRLTLEGQDIVETLAPLCAKKTTQTTLDDSVEIIEEKEASSKAEQADIQHVKEIVEVMVENVASFERQLDGVDRIISQREKNSETAVSSSTSGIEVTTNSDTTTAGTSQTFETSEDSSTVFTVSELKSAIESTPSTVGYVETSAKENGLGTSVPESNSSVGELGCFANESGLEVSMPEGAAALRMESSTPEVSAVLEEKMRPSRPKTPVMDKILPGSVSRGLSQEEIIFNQIERRNSVPIEDKIVPGSINKGDDLAVSTDESATEEISKDKSADIGNVETLSGAVKKVEIEEKILPGTISRGESPVEGPRTPKTPHSQKLVAGVVNQQENMTDLEVDESLTVVVDEDIPK